MWSPRIVAIGGTTRARSSTELALRATLAAAEEQGATTTLFSGGELAQLPFYAPENPDRPAVAVRLVDELRAADGVVLGSPGYHGGISGLVKNAIDYVEDLRDDDRPYLSGRAIGCVATGYGWQGVVATLTGLRSVAHALRGWPTPLGAGVNTVEKVFDPEGVCIDDKVDFQLRTVAAEVIEFARKLEGS